MNELIATAGQYGAMGLTLMASFWYINKKDAEHIIERDNNLDRVEKMHTEALAVTERNTEAMIELTTIIKNK